MNIRRLLIVVSLITFLTSCASVERDNRDENFIPTNLPLSILVLPPLNNSNEPLASYSYLSTISDPLVEAGYYVFPVAVIDVFLKENGLPTPAEMHSISLEKIDEIIGADAVLYITIERYGQEYQVLRSYAQVEAKAALVDVASGERLWEGRTKVVDSSNDSNNNSLAGMLFNALADQVINSSSDRSHKLSRYANRQMLLGPRGLPIGPLYEKPEITGEQ